MKLIKPIIAVFLLLTYSLAFAVELIPHFHIDNHVEYISIVQEKSQNHTNHQYIKPENKEADDVLHENHLADSLLDFVISLLSELEHPESDIFHQHLVVSELNSVTTKVLSKTKIIAVLPAIFIEPIAINPEKEFKNYSLRNYQSLIIGSSPHRGPPAFSC